MTKVLRLLLRVWVFAIFGAVFLVLFIVGGLGMLVFMAWARITGKRPAAFVQFSDIMRGSKGFRNGRRPPGGAQPEDSNVVDVQAHEVRRALEDQT